MNVLRLLFEIVGVLVVLGWLVVIVALVMLAVVARAERARKWRDLSVYEPKDGPATTYPMIRAEDLRTPTQEEIHHMCRDPRCHDLRHLERRIGRRDPSRAQPDTLERLLGPTVEEP